jgi:hypothetical protein
MVWLSSAMIETLCGGKIFRLSILQHDRLTSFLVLYLLYFIYFLYLHHSRYDFYRSNRPNP